MVDGRNDNRRMVGFMIDGRVTVRVFRAEKLGMPHPVSAVIFGVATIKGAVVTHAVLHDDDAWKDDFLLRDDCDRTAIGYRFAVVRGGNNTA